MKLENLKYQSKTDDITFRYKDKEYVICLLNDKYCTGEGGNDEDDNIFDTFEDMADNWIIQIWLIIGLYKKTNLKILLKI